MVELIIDMYLEEVFVGLAKANRRYRTIIQCIIARKIRSPMTWYLQGETNKRLSSFWVVWQRERRLQRRVVWWRGRRSQRRFIWQRGRRSQRQENRRHSVAVVWQLYGRGRIVGLYGGGGRGRSFERTVGIVWH